MKRAPDLRWTGRLYIAVPTTDESEKQSGKRVDVSPSTVRSRSERPALLPRARWPLLLLLLASSALIWVRLQKASLVPLLSLSSFSTAETCTPQAFDAGKWIARADAPTSLDTVDDIYAAFNVTGCRAEYQPLWNLGLRLPATPPFDYRLKAMSYAWRPHPSCSLPDRSMVQKLQTLVNRPLLIAGDSRSRQHFYSLSCELNDHVIWKGSTPGGDGNEVGYWRFKEQHLYLDPASPLVGALRLPRSFSYEESIVTYVMMYTPLSREEMRALPDVNTSIVPEINTSPGYPAYELPKNRTLELFLSPASHYKTMLFSTGAHFGPSLFVAGFSVEDAISVARATARVYLQELKSRMTSDQRVLARAAEAGQTDCDSHSEALIETGRQGWWYNFDYMTDINNAIRDEIELTVADSRFKWLGMDRLTRMRPDSHLPGDCLHYAVGSGVFETINRYLWHALAS